MEQVHEMFLEEEEKCLTINTSYVNDRRQNGKLSDRQIKIEI